MYARECALRSAGERARNKDKQNCDTPLWRNHTWREENSDAGPVSTVGREKEQMGQINTAARQVTVGVRAVAGLPPLQKQAEVQFDDGAEEGDFFDAEMDTG